MRLTLKSKVLLLAMVPVLLFALVLSGGAVLILKKQADTEVKDTRERLLGDRRAELEHYVQIAMGSIQAEYDRSANGDLNARAEAIARLSKVKYGKDGYIFGYDSQVVRLFRGDSPGGRRQELPRPPRSQRRLPQPRTGGGRQERQPLRDLYLAAAR
ncbi:putative chemotaxis transducer [Pseudomonas aeruginosa]|nr:putative chemotaxis transducer [Pseudomonas aeruginosa]